jgi:hypothetical protein
VAIEYTGGTEGKVWGPGCRRAPTVQATEGPRTLGSLSDLNPVVQFLSIRRQEGGWRRAWRVIASHAGGAGESSSFAGVTTVATNTASPIAVTARPRRAIAWRAHGTNVASVTVDARIGANSRPASARTPRLCLRKVEKFLRLRLNAHCRLV